MGKKFYKTMKVVHILNELKFSGAEIMYVDAAEKLKSLGCSLYVINTNQTLGEYAPFFAKSGYKVIHMPYPQSVVGRFKFYNKLIDISNKMVLSPISDISALVIEKYFRLPFSVYQ